MRNFLILIAFFIPCGCFAQFFDDFSNVEQFQKNGWQGNSTRFSIAGGNLRLTHTPESTSGTFESYLAAPVTLPEADCCWEFHAELAFNPSASNYARFYLMADKANLTDALNGYFVQLGGSKDELKLCRQNGDTITSLLETPTRLTAKNSNELQVKVSYKAGKWELFSRLNSEKEFRKAGTATSELSLKKGFLGWMCHYTNSNSKRFYLYEVNQSDCSGIVTPTDPEGEPDLPEEDPNLPNDTVYIEKGTHLNEQEGDLKIDSVEIVGDAEFLIHFNHRLHLSKAVLLVSPETYRITLAPTQFTHIAFARITPAWRVNVEYYLFWENMYDLVGNRFDNNGFSFIIESEDANLPPNDMLENEPQTFGELIITEIMANPKGCVGLPEVEYVEILNRTDKALTLEGCVFYYGEKKYPIPTTNLGAGARTILCAAKNMDAFPAAIPVVGMPSFPILANAGKLIYLENRIGTLLHWIEYSDKWYASTQQKSGGYSLEMIDTQFLYSSAENWSGSIATTGGTPGAPNSIAANHADTERPHLKGHWINEARKPELSFSKPMNKAILEQFIAHNWYADACIQPLDYPYNTRFQIGISPSEIEGLPDLQLSNITCIDGLQLYDSPPLVFSDPDTLYKGAIGINELLYQPKKGDAPFVELYNLSDKRFDLKELSLATLDADSLPLRAYPLLTESALVEPGSYVVITPNPSSVFERYGYHGTPHIVKATGFPDAGSGSGNIALIDAKGRVLDKLYYRTSMHTSTLSSLLGVSLERRDLLVSATNVRNWTSGNRATGFATPGYKNSADSQIPDSDSREISGKKHFETLFKTLRLQTDSPESELVVLYDMEESGYKLTATLYTGSGLKVVRLATNLELESTGEIVWQSEWKTNRSASPGIYVLLLEYFLDNGKSGKQKIAISIVP